MHAPFCWLTMVPRASIVTIYIHTHCLHLLLDLRLQSKRICIGIRYTTQLQVYMLHLHVHNVLSLYSILIPPQLSLLAFHQNIVTQPVSRRPQQKFANSRSAMQPHCAPGPSYIAAWPVYFRLKGPAAFNTSSLKVTLFLLTVKFLRNCMEFLNHHFHGKKWRYAHAIRMRLC